LVKIAWFDYKIIMTENPHDSEPLDPKDEKYVGEKAENSEKGTWGEDQKKRSYYYDDACGYEIYNPDIDNDEED